MVIVFGTNDLVTFTENLDFENLHKDLLLLSKLTFFYSLHWKHWKNLTVEEKEKN